MRIGRIWVAAAYVNVLSSFGIRELRPGSFSWIHGLSLFTFCTLTVALQALVRLRGVDPRCTTAPDLHTTRNPSSAP